jgi:hypothetical protein
MKLIRFTPHLTFLKYSSNTSGGGGGGGGGGSSSSSSSNFCYVNSVKVS